MDFATTKDSLEQLLHLILESLLFNQIHSVYLLVLLFIDIEFLLHYLNIDKIFRFALLLNEVLLINAQTVEKLNDASIEKALSIGAASNHIERQVCRWKLGLTIS